MGSSIRRDHFLRTILLTITCCACVCIVVFITLQITSREKHLQTEDPEENLFHSEKLTDEKCIPVCGSRNCIKQAEILLRSIKPSADPCENFNEFLCGTYAEKFSPNEGGSFPKDMTNNIRYNLKNFLENIEAEPGSASAKLKIMYDSCVNTGSDLNGVEHFKQTLNNLGIFNWPHLAPDFKFTDIDLSVLLGRLRSYVGIKIPSFAFRHTTDDETGRNEIYVEVVYNSIDNKTDIIPRDAAEDILKYFEIEIEDIETILDDHKRVTDTILNFQEEGKQYIPECDEDCVKTHINCSNTEDEGWKYLCVTALSYLNATDLKQYVTKNELSISSYSAFYAKNVILRLKTLPDRSLANYFALNLLWRNLGEVNLFFRLKKHKYFKYFKTEEKPTMDISSKWKFCVEWIIEKMNPVLENEYAKSSFTRTYFDEIHEIHLNYTSTVAEMISHQDWIFPEAKTAIINHITSLECNMEYIKQNLPNDTYFDEYLKAFNPSSKSFFHNALDLMKCFLNTYTRLKFPFTMRIGPRFHADASTDKEQYINIEFGILMPPTYYPDQYRYINQILVSPIFNHEIGHNLVFLISELAQTSKELQKIYFERKKCIEKQFTKFRFHILDENLNGTRYFEENLSDNLGYSIADKMIKNFGSSEEAFLLPAVPYSTEQQLIMSSSQVYCSKLDLSEEVEIKIINKHAPSEFRIIGTRQNSKEYSEVFKCPVGSYMNPTEKCTFLDM